MILLGFSLHDLYFLHESSVVASEGTLLVLSLLQVSSELPVLLVDSSEPLLSLLNDLFQLQILLIAHLLTHTGLIVPPLLELRYNPLEFSVILTEVSVCLLKLEDTVRQQLAV